MASYPAFTVAIALISYFIISNCGLLANGEVNYSKEEISALTRVQIIS